MINKLDITLTDGKPVTPDHKTIDPATGMQKGYVVLSTEERAKGFVEPVRSSYVHDKCGTVTTMGRSLAETYARDPYFYTGTFCCHCKGHFPVGEDGEFTWADGSGKVGAKTKCQPTPYGCSVTVDEYCNQAWKRLSPEAVRVQEMEALLSSARCIAERHGADTDWDNFSSSIAKLGISKYTARVYKTHKIQTENDNT